MTVRHLFGILLITLSMLSCLICCHCSWIEFSSSFLAWIANLWLKTCFFSISKTCSMGVKSVDCAGNGNFWILCCSKEFCAILATCRRGLSCIVVHKQNIFTYLCSVWSNNRFKNMITIFISRWKPFNRNEIGSKRYRKTIRAPPWCLSSSRTIYKRVALPEAFRDVSVTAEKRSRL